MTERSSSEDLVTIGPASPQGIVIEFPLSASLEDSFAALTTPALVKQWLTGPEGTSLPVCEIDLQVGGEMRMVWRTPNGDIGMRGTYQDVSPPTRVIHTELFDEDWTAGETLVTHSLRRLDDQTLVEVRIDYSGEMVRDMILDSPAVDGMRAGYARLIDRIGSFTVAE